MLQFLPDTKKREPDPVLRLTIVEALLLLCTTRAGRDRLRNNGVYEIVKVMHLSEQDEKVSHMLLPLSYEPNPWVSRLQK